jgi:PPP family 3-phenylpropionic acid transporter
MYFANKFQNKSIFLAKSIFFMVYAAASVLLPFLALYFEQRGLSGAQIGVLAAIPPVMTMIGASVWGSLADATQRHKQIFLLVIIGAGLSVILIPLADSFLSLSLLVALHAFCFMSLIPLLDNSALEILGSQAEKYGQIRLWGSLGWGLGAPLIGPLVEQLGLNWTFYGHAGLMLAGLLIALPLPVAQKSSGSGFSQGLSRLLHDPRWYLFLLVIFVAGFGDALVRNYWFLYLKEIGTGSVLMGLSLTIGMVSELVVLFFSRQLIQRFGTRKLLLLGASVQAARLLGWSLIADPYAALSLQLLNGLAFGALWLAGVAYAKEIAPAGLSTMAQGLLSGVYFGFSSVLGALSGGFLYEQVGIWGMYGWGAAVMWIGLLIYVLAGSGWVKMVARQPVELS